ncbi:MAG: PilZ domain-containing protein [Candidatus Competibacterales bacterium]
MGNDSPSIQPAVAAAIAKGTPHGISDLAAFPTRERRSSTRYTLVDGPEVFENPRGRPLGRLLDASVTGLCFESEAFFDLYTPFELWLSMDLRQQTGWLSLQCRSLWYREAPLGYKLIYGCRVYNMDPGLLVFLKRQPPALAKASGYPAPGPLGARA